MTDVCSSQVGILIVSSLFAVFAIIYERTVYEGFVGVGGIEGVSMPLTFFFFFCDGSFTLVIQKLSAAMFEVRMEQTCFGHICFEACPQTLLSSVSAAQPRSLYEQCDWGSRIAFWPSKHCERFAITACFFGTCNDDSLRANNFTLLSEKFCVGRSQFIRAAATTLELGTRLCKVRRTKLKCMQCRALNRNKSRRLKKEKKQKTKPRSFFFLF